MGSQKMGIAMAGDMVGEIVILLTDLPTRECMNNYMLRCLSTCCVGGWTDTVEPRLSGPLCAGSHPEKQKVWIIKVL